MLYQGELAHRALKAFYPLTNKLDTPTQLARHERRRRLLRRIAESGQSICARKDTAIDVLPAGIDLKYHHYIPTLSRNHPLDLFRFLRQHDNDPAVAVGTSLFKVHLIHDNSQGFIPKLKDHLLYRLRGLDVSYCDHVFTDDERNSIIIPDNKIYSVQTMQVCCIYYQPC
jgi:hypothetical protein